MTKNAWSFESLSSQIFLKKIEVKFDEEPDADEPIKPDEYNIEIVEPVFLTQWRK